MDMTMGAATDNTMLQLRQGALAKTLNADGPGRSAAIDVDAIRKTAKEFESVFASEMLSHMFSGIETNGLMGGGHGEEMFRSMLVDQYGKALAASGTLGIADRVAAQMIRTQEQLG